ncbi:hypothetical protein H5410_059664 [Solanum commersonii]|uniref:Uncharacterized protein n=1 Tax=Solanum commersonii TaxID=4109 RepID=A0A9J5W348_SOLCO|nr:hypothetical protein H5410_059664 [Solanum commersonii]
MTSMLRSLILVWPNCLVLVNVISQLESTFGYVAPEYANTGLLNEKSDIYSFGGRVVKSDHRKRSCGLWPSCPRGALSFVPYLHIYLAHLMLIISFKTPPNFVLRVLKMMTYICSPDVDILIIVKSFELHVEFLVNWLSGKNVTFSLEYLCSSPILHGSDC